MGREWHRGYTERMNRIFSLTLVFGLLLSIGGCQTARHREFDSVRTGMAKDQALAAVGGPTRTIHRNGVDRWTYFLWAPEGGSQQVREIHFSEGIAVYVGAPLLPRVSADEQDQINAGALAERSGASSVFEILNDTSGDGSTEKTAR